MNTVEWVKVYETLAAYKAMMVQSVLKEHSINSVILNQQDSVYTFGEISVFVALNDSIDALKIIDDEVAT